MPGADRQGGQDPGGPCPATLRPACPDIRHGGAGRHGGVRLAPHQSSLCRLCQECRVYLPEQLSSQVQQTSPAPPTSPPTTPTTTPTAANTLVLSRFREIHIINESYMFDVIYALVGYNISIINLSNLMKHFIYFQIIFISNGHSKSCNN